MKSISTTHPTFSNQSSNSNHLGWFLIAMCLGLAAGSVNVQAANQIWLATPSTANWNNTANWSTATVPTTGDVLFFGASSTTSLNNDIAAATQFNGITYSNGASAFTFAGNQITLGGNVTNNSTALQTINFPIAATAVRTFNTFGGGGDITLGGVFSGTAGGLTKAGAGTLTLNGSTADTFTGNTTVTGGTFLEDFVNATTASAGLLPNTSTLTLGQGAFSIKGQSSGTTAQTLGNLTLSAATGSGITLNPNGGTSTTLTLGTTWTRNVGSTLNIDLSAGGTLASTVAAGNLGYATVKDATATGFANASGSAITRLTGQTTLPTSGTVATTDYIVSNGTTMNPASFSVNSLTMDSTAGGFTLDLGGVADVMTITKLGLLMIGGNNVTIADGIVGAAGAEDIVHTMGAGTLTIAGKISTGAGALTKDGNGTLILSGNNTNTGAIAVNAGTLTLSGTNSFTGAITVNGGATLNITAGTNVFLNNVNAGLRIGNSATGIGTWSVSPGAIFSGPGGTTIFYHIGSFATSVGIVNNAGTMNVSPAGFLVTDTSGSSAAVYNSGTLNATLQGNNFDMGNGVGAYGYVNNSGTLLVSGSTAASGALSLGHSVATGGAIGVLDVTAGTVTQTRASNLWLNANIATTSGPLQQVSQVNITGGSLIAGSVNSGIVQVNGKTLGTVNVVNGYASINVTGTGAFTTPGASGGVNLNVNNAASNISTLSLASGGTLNSSSITSGGTTSSQVLSLNGGNLNATAAGTLISANVTTYVEAGGANTISNGGFNTEIDSALLAPVADGVSTYGVTGITLGGTLTGYIGAPAVVFSGGGGMGAAAIANFNPTTGTITGITITSPGSGYTSAPTIVLLGGSGSNGVGALAGTATATATIGSVSSGGVTFTGSGTTTLTGANTYTGTTTNNGGTLQVNGSIAGNVVVNSGATNGGSGTISGNVMVNSGGHTRPSASSGVTSYIGGNLTYNTGSRADFNLSSTFNGVNDQIVLNGASSVLTCGSVSVGINCGLVLDTTTDYVLFNLTGGSPSISGNFSATPVWLGTTPAGAAFYSIVKTNGNQIVLHYAGSTPPSISSATANPSTVVHNQTTMLTVSVTPGANPTITNVTVNLSSVGGTNNQALYFDSINNVWTNTVLIGSSATNPVALPVVATDAGGFQGSCFISLTVSPTTTTWNGASASDNNWTDNMNWVGAEGPGFVGDGVTFDGSTRLTPNMDTNYSITSLAFNGTAGAFTIGSANGSMLTLAGDAVNNSASTETVNVPVALAAPVTLNAASGNLVFGQNITNGPNLITVADVAGTTNAVNGVIVGTGGLTMNGNGTLLLAGNNAYTGTTTINSGATTLSGSNNLASAIAINGGALTLSTNNTLSGVATITAGSLNIAGGTTTYSSVANPNLNLGNSATLSATLNVSLGATFTMPASTTSFPFIGSIADGVAIVNNAGTVNVASAGFLVSHATSSSAAIYNSGTFTANLDGNNFDLGNGTGSYSYLNNSGTLSVAGTTGATGILGLGWGNAAAAGASSTIDVTGGTFSVAVGTHLTLNDNVAQSSQQTSQINVLGGTLTAGSVTAGVVPVNGFANAYASINVSGGTFTTPGAGGINLNVANNATDISTLSLANGGTLNSSSITSAGTSSSQVLTLNGGNLNATAAGTLISANVTTYVEASGVNTISNGFNTTISSALLAPVADGVSTFGVTGITLGGTDTGYIGAPVVVISGTGTGAAAIANFNPATGTITGFTVTSPGSGYTSAPTVTLIGGSGTSGVGATAGAATATAVIGPVSSGGLVINGAGTLYLDAANTYTGTTVVTNGTLAGIGSISSAMVVAPAGSLGAGDAAAVGTFTINSNLTLQGNAVLRINKTGGTPVHDNVIVSGSITYGGTLTVSNITSDATPLTTSDTFQLFSVSGTHFGNFASIVGSPGAGLAYSFNPSSGVLSVVTGSAPISALKFTFSPVISGTSLTISVTNAGAGTFYLLTSTNVAAPLNAWTPFWTNVASGSGSFTTNLLNAVNPANKQQFYILSTTNN